jgi:integrase
VITTVTWRVSQGGRGRFGEAARGRAWSSARPEACTKTRVSATLSALLGLAVDDGIILSNPALGSGRKHRTKAARAQATATVKVKALDAEQAARFLTAARELEPDVYPAFMLETHGGLRSGEALGLKWGSVDLDGRTMRIHEQLRDATTKSGAERTVDVSAPLADLLRDIMTRRREEGLAAGHGGEISPYVVFPWLSEQPSAQGGATSRQEGAAGNGSGADGGGPAGAPHAPQLETHVLLASRSPGGVTRLCPDAGWTLQLGDDGWGLRLVVAATGTGCDGPTAGLLVTRRAVLVTDSELSSLS